MANTILHDILVLAVSSDASDIHIKQDAPAMLRIHGDLVASDFVPDKELLQTFIEQVATPTQQAEYEKAGDLDMSHYEDDAGRFRMNIHRQRGSYAINFRWVKNTVRTFEELGLPEVLRSVSEAPRGIIIMTGTTGSGKSTTMAAMLEHVNQTLNKHIITIEDPIEYEFIDRNCIFEQREVGIDTASFSSALVHALRQDPDIIMVGEMRDKVSFEAALQAADTGHLVMTTLHASNASQTINRILDFYPKDEQDPIREALANNLTAIISQRLAPKIGGGRAPVNEILLNTPIVTKLIQEDKLEKLPSAIQTGQGDGMMTFNQRLLELVNNGLVSEEDALEYSDNPEALKMNFEGIFLSTGNSGLI